MQKQRWIWLWLLLAVMTVSPVMAVGDIRVPESDPGICNVTRVTIGDWWVEAAYDGYSFRQTLDIAEGYDGSTFYRAIYTRDNFGYQSLRLRGYRKTGKPIFVRDFDPAYEFSDQAYGISAEVTLSGKGVMTTKPVRIGNHEQTFEDLDVSLFNYFPMGEVETTTLMVGEPLEIVMTGDLVNFKGVLSGRGFEEAVQWAKTNHARFFANVSKKRCPDFNNVNPDHENEDGDAGAS